MPMKAKNVNYQQSQTLKGGVKSSRVGGNNNATGPCVKPVPRAVWSGRDAFYTEFVDNSLPVVFINAAKEWPCVRRWTPEYLCKIGHGVPVEIACGECEETLQGNMLRHKQQTTLDAFVKSISTRRGNIRDGTAPSLSKPVSVEHGGEKVSSSLKHALNATPSSHHLIPASHLS